MDSKKISRCEVVFKGKHYFSPELETFHGCTFVFDPTQMTSDGTLAGTVAGKQLSLCVNDVQFFTVEVVEEARCSRAKTRQALLEDRIRQS